MDRAIFTDIETSDHIRQASVSMFNVQIRKSSKSLIFSASLRATFKKLYIKSEGKLFFLLRTAGQPNSDLRNETESE